MVKIIHNNIIPIKMFDIARKIMFLTINRGYERENSVGGLGKIGLKFLF
jgi:hypothetical protein